MENKDALDKQKVDLEYDKLAETEKTMRSAKLSIFLVFGSFILWASLVPLDEGVPLIGNVVIDTKRKAVQHASGGVIKEIFVKEGQFVNVDDSLIKLSDLTLLNELAIEKNNIKSLMERVTGLKVEKKNFDDLIISTEEQKQFIEEELNGIKSLVEDGFAPRIRQLELERELSQVKSKLKELRNSIEKNQQSILESEFRLEAVEEKIFIIQRKIKGTLIKAKFAGQVIDLQKQAVGEVVRSAEKIMDIIPETKGLL